VDKKEAGLQRGRFEWGKEEDRLSRGSGKWVAKEKDELQRMKIRRDDGLQREDRWLKRKMSCKGGRWMKKGDCGYLPS
jgi:hypothetical protein